MKRELRDARRAFWLWRRRHGDDEIRLQLLDLARSYVFPHYQLADSFKSWWGDEEFFAHYERLATSSYHAENTFFLKELLKLVDHLDGNTAEAGVFRGSSSWFICDARDGHASTHFAFDSFEGLPEPDHRDGTHWRAGMLQADEAAARSALSPFRAQIYKGWIPEVFNQADWGPLVFGHIDVDLYDPTLASLEAFYPNLVPGGILLCDDYGVTTCPGARRAFDEYMGSRPEPIVLCPTGQGFIIKR
jgi:hypothetical protein